MVVDNGGAAFPGLYGAKLAEFSELGENAVKVLDAQTGMTLRDYFAGKALGAMHSGGSDIFVQSLVSPNDAGEGEHRDYVEERITTLARTVYAIADAMIAERAR
jgi:hypothetical protein